MAQTAMTVRLDSDVKSRFDSLCSEFGMSANTAFTIFVNAVIRYQKIPFEIEAAPKTSTITGKNNLVETQEKAINAVKSMRAKAQELPEMSLDEINEEIRLAREERKKRHGL